MTSAQKVIKYMAIAFAIFLIISIVSVALKVSLGVATIFNIIDNSNKEVVGETRIIKFENDDITTLDIDIAYTKFIIKTGEIFEVETNNNNIKCEQDDDTIKIKEKNYNLFSNKSETAELVLYVPEGFEFEKVKINAGAGKINIQNLITKKLSFQLGAGETDIENLKVSRECDIEGGAGKIDIASGTINNLKLDMGVGETKITAKLEGNNEINAGIGNLKINLEDKKENYKIKTSKGIGNIKIDGKEIANEEKYGSGENYIEIDGGIGNITIDFE